MGCYEQPLHPHIQEALSGRYSRILNIGCAEGYYAVGFARANPDLISAAFDIDPKAQAACRELAEKNDVSDRVEIGSVFMPADFAKYENEAVLVFCDIEGMEEELLDPSVAPALSGFDIIVESHECLRPGITEKLISRFQSSHQSRSLKMTARGNDNLPGWFTELSHLDQLLATWEWRTDLLRG